jgi:hypothetical protein
MGALAQQTGRDYVIIENPNENSLRDSINNPADFAMANGFLTEDSLYLLASPLTQHQATVLSVRFDGELRDLEANPSQMSRFNAGVRDKLAVIQQNRPDEIPILTITEGSRIVHTPILPGSNIATFGPRCQINFGSAYLDHVIHPAFRELRINSRLFSLKWNRDYRIPGNCPVNEKRGGLDYHPPKGWLRYGKAVLGMYKDGDTWIGQVNGPGEWPVAYHGMSPVDLKSIMEGSLQAGCGAVYGKGIYCSPYPEEAAGYSMRKPLTLKVGNETKSFLIMLMCRVNPEIVCECSKLNRTGKKCPREKDARFTLHKATDRIWFVNADNANSKNSRVYGILIKEV